MATRKRYDRQFKLSAAKLIVDEHMAVPALANELAIKDTTLKRELIRGKNYPDPDPDAARQDIFTYMEHY